ncbi:MAG: DUF3786 domain-containing protein, partial [Nitrospirae bacterium]
YKELPKTNCGKCNYKTCMAFAVSVSRGDEVLSSCPFLEPERVEELSKSIKKVDWREDLIASLKEEVKNIPLSEVAEGIGATPLDGALKIRFLEKDFIVRQDGEIESGAGSTAWERILLLLYIKNRGSGELSNRWVSFSELKGGYVKVEGLKKDCEKPLSEIIEKHIDKIDDIFLRLGAETLKEENADKAWKLYLLPKIPIKILYWHPVEEFPSGIKILFDSTADRFLDIESLIFLCEGFVHKIEHMID